MVDANQEVVGVITELHPDQVDVLVRLDSGPVLLVAKPEFLEGDNGQNPFFESTDCMSPALGFPASGGFMPTALIGPPGFTVYLPVTSETVFAVLKSTWIGGECRSQSGDGLFIEYDPVQELLITPPFEVE